MYESQTWRDLLGDIISDPLEKRRLSDALEVTPITLVRWVNGSSQPRQVHLQRLLNALPEQREKLQKLVMQELGYLLTDGDAEPAPKEVYPDIPTVCYTHVLKMYATTPPALLPFALSHFVLQQMVEQLDPERAGMHIRIAKCVPPDEQTPNIRSLYVFHDAGMFTSLANQQELLGVESLAGYAVEVGHTVVIDDFFSEDGKSFFPLFEAQTSQEEMFERSAAATPLLRAESVAGCVIVSSTQPHYFTKARLSLIEQYSHLLLLAFPPDEFYPFDQLSLGVMPPYWEQKPYLQALRLRISAIMREKEQQQQPIPPEQAELLALKDLERTLLTWRPGQQPLTEDADPEL